MEFQVPTICKRLTLWKLMVIIPFFYLLLVWWGYQYMERHMQHNRRLGKIFKPQLDKNGSIQWYVNHCPIYYHARRKHQISHVQKTNKRKEMCSLPSLVTPPDIQMENEWNSISVKYPQYVYTVSGWIQVIDVPNYTPKSLHVIIVPHSHQDPGWKESYEGYYTSYTKNTLNHIVTHLSKNPKLKFIWSEMTYLKKWFDEEGTDTDGLVNLIKNGQLEIVTGGWVMTDEAVTHYSAMLNQLVDGHQWVKEKLGVLPKTSWSVDPFGHSPTMAYLLSKAGIRNMVIQRAHFGVKRHFAKKQFLEFMWKQSWDALSGSTMLCHMMPFLLYAIPYSCGPDPHVCCQFDFYREKCFYGTESSPTISVNDKNIRKLAWALWEQFQKKSQLYRSNVLLVPHGDDFRYNSASEWSSQFDNLGKLMDYMNKDGDMDIKIEYGTISDYFKALEQSQEKLNFDFPSLVGDFFPYNDRDDQYWTGFYSVRPLLKHMIRVLQAKLRIAEILFTLKCSQLEDAKSGFTSCSMQMPTLLEGRHAVNLFQHHDAITGTSKHYVMNNYGKIMRNAMLQLDSLLIGLMVTNAEKILGQPNNLQPKNFIMTEKWDSKTGLPVVQVNKLNGKWLVIVTNPLTISWKSPVTVRTSSPFIVKSMHTLVPSQVNPVWDSDLKPIDDLYDIVFEADLMPLAVHVYHFLQDSTMTEFAHVSISGADSDASKFMNHFKSQKTTSNTVDIENEFLRASFSTCTGTLQYTLNKVEDEVHHTSIQMVTYGTGSFMNPFKDKSGAYIFMPDGPAKEMDIQYPPMIVIKGPVMSSVIVKLPGVIHAASLYNIPGPMSRGVHLHNTVDIRDTSWDNKELTMRIVSDVMSPDTSICVDLNGFQMFKKKWRSKFLIQGNFHPVTTGAYIENEESSRLTLLTSETHGFASLKQGWLEATLDRRLMQDDWRGLNEGPTDNTLSPSKFILIPEKRNIPGEVTGLSCFMSPVADLLSQHLNNPPQVAFMMQEMAEPPQYITSVPYVSFLHTPIPCPFVLVNLRHQAETFTKTRGAKLSALLTLHRVGIDCNFSDFASDCKSESYLDLNVFSNTKLKRAVETSITGVEDLQNLPSFVAKLKFMQIVTIRVTFSNSH